MGRGSTPGKGRLPARAHVPAAVPFARLFDPGRIYYVPDPLLATEAMAVLVLDRYWRFLPRRWAHIDVGGWLPSLVPEGEDFTFWEYDPLSGPSVMRLHWRGSYAERTPLVPSDLLRIDRIALISPDGTVRWGISAA